MNRATPFAMTDTKLYVPVETLSTPDNARLLQQLISGFQRTVNWSKYWSNVSTQAKDQYLDYLIGPSFQWLNRFFILSFENNAVRTGYTE